MVDLSFRRHRFPPVVVQHAVWLYLRSVFSYRDVADLLAERALDISYETVRSWVLKFGPVIAHRPRQHRPRPSDRWHLDKMVVRTAGKRMYLWRAVDHERQVLDMLVRRRRDSRAALRLMRKLLKKQGFAPRLLVTDKLRSYASGLRQLGLTCPQEQGLRRNNRAANSHQVVRQRAQAATFQVGSVRPAFPWRACRPQYLQPSTPPRLAIHTAEIPSRRRQPLAKCCPGGVTAHCVLSPFGSLQLNLTMPRGDISSSGGIVRSTWEQSFPAVADAPDRVDHAAPAQISRGHQSRPLAHSQEMTRPPRRGYNSIEA
jgi:putative transposase